MNANRRRLVVLGSVALISPLVVTAQRQEKIHRVGLLLTGSPSTSGEIASKFTKGLRDLGYVEGKNITLDMRWAEGKEERFPGLAAELVARRPGAIAASGSSAIKACKEATSTIPIVMLGASDPIGSGFVASLAQPGGNITGLSALAVEILPKQVELLHNIVPNATRVGVLAGNNAISALYINKIRDAARGFGWSILRSIVERPEEFERGVTLLTRQKVDAVIVTAYPYFLTHRKQLADLLLKARIPALYPFGLNADAGGLIAYGASYPDMFERGAGYVDKILKGARPADLPVEQPNVFELVVNLGTAKALGITIPPVIMARADRVIE